MPCWHSRTNHRTHSSMYRIRPRTTTWFRSWGLFLKRKIFIELFDEFSFLFRSMIYYPNLNAYFHVYNVHNQSHAWYAILKMTCWVFRLISVYQKLLSPFIDVLMLKYHDLSISIFSLNSVERFLCLNTPTHAFLPVWFFNITN